MGCATLLITMSISSSCISDFPVKRRAFSDLITLPWTVVPLCATTTLFATRLESNIAVKSAPVWVVLVLRLSTMRTVMVVPARTITDAGLGAGGGGGGGGGGTANSTASTAAREYVF